MDRQFVRQWFGTDGSYAAYVEAYLADRRLPEALEEYLEWWEK